MRPLLLAALLAGCAGCAPEPPLRPHVLLLTVDTLRPDYLSFFGYDRPTAPFLDALLARSMVFTRAVTPIARTTPALASLFTGVYPHGHGVRRLFDTLSPRVPTLAELARGRGYATVAIVSNLILQEDRGLGRGFDVYDVAAGQRAAEPTTDAALERVREIDPDHPLFLWVHYVDPHVPYHPPPELARRFDPDYRGRYALHFGAEPDGVGNRAYPEDLGKARAIFRNPLPESVNRHVRRLYAADVRATDDAIARLLSGLEERFGGGWSVVFTSDHGESLGEHDYYWEHGDFVYAASLRVPLAIALPSGDPLQRVGRIDDWVSLVDLFPTLLELMGIESSAPPDTDGARSLVPYLAGRAPEPRPVYAESGASFFPAELRGRRIDFGLKGRLRAVIDGRHKLIWTPGREPAFELYDLLEDPLETRNLYRPDHPEAQRLGALLEDWLREEPAATSGPSPEDLDQLRELGYVE